MTSPKPVRPVKLLVAILYREKQALMQATDALSRHWGEIDFAGTDHAFDMTDYYKAEMGEGLVRRLVSFSRLVPPESIRGAKLICNEIEERLMGKGGRRANLDIGYLDHHKVVLASVKGAGHKIHLGDGVWADLVGRYRDGRYQPFDWTFPDFSDGRYDDELASIRKMYLHESKTQTQGD